MVVYSFFIFDRHCECIYMKQWYDRDGSKLQRPMSSSSATGSTMQSLDKRISSATKQSVEASSETGSSKPHRLSSKDDAKLVFGVIFSLRNMVRKLAGPEDSFLCYRTSQYKLHYYETLTQLKFVMLTDVRTESLKSSLHQIYVNLYVEYVVKNPLSDAEHPEGKGVANELFELGIDSFVVSPSKSLRAMHMPNRLHVLNG